MALLFCDSVRHYSTTARIAEKWTTNSGVTVDANYGRGNGASLRIASSTSAANNVTKTLASNYATLIVGFRFQQRTELQATDIRSFLALMDGSSYQLSFGTDATDHLVVWRGDYSGTLLATSTNTLLPNTLYHIEIKATIHDSTGAVEVRVNGTSTDWIAITGQDTQATANAYANKLYLRNARASSGVRDRYFSDIVIADTSGSYNNDFLGEVNVDAYLPDGAGTYAQLTASAGSNYACVDETDPNTTDYVSSGTNGHKDSYAFTDMVGNNPIIKAVVNNLWALKTDSGTVYAKSVAVTGPTDSPPTEYVGSNLTPTTTYTCLQNIYEVNPATSAAWIKAEVNSAEFGVQVSTS